MSAKKEKQDCSDENMVELRISGHSVSLSFAKEPDATVAQRVRNCLIDSFIRQDTARRGAA
jgi:hypothetical protein